MKSTKTTEKKSATGEGMLSLATTTMKSKDKNGEHLTPTGPQSKRPPGVFPPCFQQQRPPVTSAKQHRSPSPSPHPFSALFLSAVCLSMYVEPVLFRTSLLSFSCIFVLFSTNTFQLNWSQTPTLITQHLFISITTLIANHVSSVQLIEPTSLRCSQQSRHSPKLIPFIPQYKPACRSIHETRPTLNPCGFRANL